MLNATLLGINYFEKFLLLKKQKMLTFFYVLF